MVANLKHLGSFLSSGDPATAYGNNLDPDQQVLYVIVLWIRIPLAVLRYFVVDPDPDIQQDHASKKNQSRIQRSKRHRIRIRNTASD